MVREPIFHTCTTFFIILFFLACHSLNMQHQTNSFIEKNVYFMHIQTKQIVDTSSHTGSVSISTRKRNPHFSRRFAFFAALSRELMIFIQIFSVAFPAVGYQYVLCVSFSASCEGTKKVHLSSRASFYPNRKICKRIHLHGGVYRKFDAGS